MVRLTHLGMSAVCHFLSLALVIHLAASASISFHSTLDSTCSSYATATYRMSEKTDFSTSWCASEVKEVINSDDGEPSNRRDGELNMWCSDSDLLFRWCAGITQNCGNARLGQHLGRNNCSDFFSLIEHDVRAFGEGQCVSALGSNSTRYYVKLVKRAGAEFIRLPDRCMSSERRLPARGGAGGSSSGGGSSSKKVKEPPPEGPGEAFGAAILGIFMGFFFLLVITLLILNKTIGHRFVVP